MVIIFVHYVCVYVCMSVEKNKFMGKRAVARFSDPQLSCGKGWWSYFIPWLIINDDRRVLYFIFFAERTDRRTYVHS